MQHDLMRMIRVVGEARLRQPKTATHENVEQSINVAKCDINVVVKKKDGAIAAQKPGIGLVDCFHRRKFRNSALIDEISEGVGVVRLLSIIVDQQVPLSRRIPSHPILVQRMIAGANNDEKGSARLRRTKGDRRLSNVGPDRHCPNCVCLKILPALIRPKRHCDHATTPARAGSSFLPFCEP